MPSREIEAKFAGVMPAAENSTDFGILGAISASHFLNDMIQSLIFAIYPVLQSGFDLSFAQIGMITLTYQITASLLQPAVGLYTDRRPLPYSLPIGMGFTLLGLLLLSIAPTFPLLLLAAGLVGMGSSVFHPESSRVARMASGGRHGLAQSVFQVGGNMGSSLGPLLAAWIIVPRGRGSVAWFSLAALVAIFLLIKVSHWYKLHRHGVRGKPQPRRQGQAILSRSKIFWSLLILGLLIFSKYFYLASLSSYYTFYLIHKFGLSVQSAQVYLFIFLFSVAAGTLILPYASLFWTGALTVIIGLILASAFSAILVYAQELIPGKVGTISGLFFGFAFGMGGIGAAVLGHLADLHGIEYVYQLCAFLPLIGIITVFLPNLEKTRPVLAT